MMRRAGAAWLDLLPVDDNVFIRREQGRQRETHHRESWRKTWGKRPGRANDGALDERKAQAAARDLIVERELELLAEAKASDTGPQTFGELVEAWLAERAAEVADRSLKPSTYRDYAAMLAAPDAPVRKHGNARKGHVLKALGNRQLDAITNEDVEALLRKMRAAGLSPATRAKYRTVLKMILDFGVVRGWTEANPMSTGRQKRQKRREKALLVYDLDVVEQIATEAGGMVGEVVRLGALTGLRQGELLALRWESVDFIGRKLTVSKTYVAGIGEDVPKSNKTRTIPLSDQAAVVLDRVSKRDENTRKGDLVFANPKGKHLDASWLRRRYAEARKKVIENAKKEGNTLPVVVFHGLRHTFGSRAAAAGIPLSDIQALMGHADLATTAIYLHYQPQHDAAERLSRAFSEGTVAEAVEVAAVA